MRFYNLLLILIFSYCSAFSQNIITTSGQNFVPSNLSIFIGDSVTFILGNNHNAVEVDSFTYYNNGSSPLAGGFNIGFGQDSTISLDTTRTYYYVCQSHVNNGMKGIISVLPTPIYGCTDSSACNFDSLATVDNGSCQYDDTSYIFVTSCDNYLWDGIFYDSSGTYSNLYTNAYGCDSLVFLNLTLNYST